MDPIFIRLTDGFVCALRATVADGRPLISMTNCHGMEHVTVPTIEANITLLNSLMDVLENTDMPFPRLGQLQNMIQEADGADKILSRLPKQVNVSMHQAWCKAEAHKLIDVWQFSCRSLRRARGSKVNAVDDFKKRLDQFLQRFKPRRSSGDGALLAIEDITEYPSASEDEEEVTEHHQSAADDLMTSDEELPEASMTPAQVDNGWEAFSMEKRTVAPVAVSEEPIFVIPSSAEEEEDKEIREHTRPIATRKRPAAAPKASVAKSKTRKVIKRWCKLRLKNGALKMKKKAVRAALKPAAPPETSSVRRLRRKQSVQLPQPWSFDMSVDDLDELKMLAWDERVQAFTAKFPLRRVVTCRSVLKTEHGQNFAQVRVAGSGGQALCQLTKTACDHYALAVKPLLDLAGKGATRAELHELKHHECFYELFVKDGSLC